MPKVSIIMGIYNCKSKTDLDRSINSIINQTFKDWELIICDDGSNDNGKTLNYLEELCHLDSRIRYISYPVNRGLAYALNTCLKQAKGEYVARQDDDDFSNSERLKIQYNFLEQNLEIDLVGTNAEVFNNEGVWGKYIVAEHPTKDDFLWNSPFIHPSILVRKKSLEKVGGYRISKETRRCEDYDLFMRMYARGMKGYNIQQNLYHYKIENGNNKHRPMKYRIDEAIVRIKGYQKLGILFKGIPFIIKPILVGFIPQVIFKLVKKQQYS